MKKKGFPAGNPDEDQEKLRVWWTEEMEKCGFSGQVSVEYAPCEGEAPSWGTGKRLFEGLVMSRSQVMNAHMYRSTIPGAPWPLDALVVTMEDGIITQVIYHAGMKISLQGDVRFTHKLGLLGTKLEVEGVDAERFKSQKELLKKCKKALRFRYDIPLRGFSSGKTVFQLEEATLGITTGKEGADVVVSATVQTESAFIGQNYSLGLAQVVETLKAIEQAN